jgi:hypothetical protein
MRQALGPNSQFGRRFRETIETVALAEALPLASLNRASHPYGEAPPRGSAVRRVSNDYLSNFDTRNVAHAGSLGWATRFANKSSHAGFVEFGNDPGGGYIYPKKGKLLAFENHKGEIVFAKRVRAALPTNIVSRSVREGVKRRFG